jgi:hypothetical protein
MCEKKFSSDFRCNAVSEIRNQGVIEFFSYDITYRGIPLSGADSFQLISAILSGVCRIIDRQNLSTCYIDSS